MPTPTTFTVLLAPGQSTPELARDKVKADGRTVGALAKSSSVVGITEAVGNDAADFGAGLPDGFSVTHQGNECPVWLGPDWTVEGTREVRLHAGLAKVSPHRILSIVAAKHDSGTRVRFINTHFVSQAWNGKTDSAEAWRREMWNKSFPILVKEVTVGANAGVTTVVMGDMNTGPQKRGATLRLGAGQVHAYNSNLDHIWVIPGKGASVTAGAATRKNLNSDHDLAIVSVTVTTADAPKPPPVKKPIPAVTNPGKVVNLGKDTSGRPLMVDQHTLDKLRVAEKALGHKLTVVQGSYRAGKGAAASAGTHDAGGCIDLRSWDLPKNIAPQAAVRTLRLCGLIAWYRTPTQGFDPHIHCVDRGNKALSRDAANQEKAFLAGKNGLASGRADDGARVAVPVDAPKDVPPVAVITPDPLTGFKPSIDGIDISHFQGGKLDFTQAQKAGVKFVYHKATESLGFTDNRYAGRRKEIAASGIPFGAYHFARPAKSNGTAQAKFFLSVAKPKKGDLRPCLDLEDRGGLGDSQLMKWTQDFVDEVKRQTGKPPVLYTNFDLPKDPGCFLWRARYSNANALPKPLKSWDRWAIWQFSNGVFGAPKSVPGIGHCDINTLAPGFDVKRLLL